MATSTLTRTVSATEFNRHSSKILRMADAGDVIVTDRGIPTYQLSRIAPDESDKLEQLIRVGLFSRPTEPRIPTQSKLTAEQALAAIEQFEHDRGSQDYDY